GSSTAIDITHHWLPWSSSSCTRVGRSRRASSTSATATASVGPASSSSLRAFVQWMENQSDAAILDNEGASVDDDEDAVRVLTIHGAKGLEFPIVFLGGLSAAPMTNIPPLYSADFT